MKRALKWALIAIVILIIFGFWYNWRYSMGIVDAYTVNKPTIENKLLIATQKSEYKDKVTQYITEYYFGKNIYISVIDITDMDQVDKEQYGAFVIIHTYEMWMPPENVRSFLNDNEIRNKVFTVSTSGDGHLIPEGVDGVTSASIIMDTQKDAEKVIKWINNQLAIET